MHDGDLLVVKELAILHAPVVRIVVHDREIEFGVEQRADRVQRVFGRNADFKRRVAAAQSSHQRGQPVISGVAMRETRSSPAMLRASCETLASTSPMASST